MGKQQIETLEAIYENLKIEEILAKQEEMFYVEQYVIDVNIF